jgi:hypothetical protein
MLIWDKGRATILAVGNSPTAASTEEIRMIAKLTLALASCAFFTFHSATLAVAQVEAPEPAPAKIAAPSATLTPQQLESFSDLTGDAKRTVQYRLSTNARLVPLAAAAADARTSRRSTGKVMAIVGFTILGVGDIAGSYILVTTPGYPNIQSGHTNRIFLSLGVAVGSLAIGLALGITGIHKMAHPTEVEERALDAYSPGWRDVSFQFPPPQVLGKTVASPVWSFTF